MVLNGNRIDVTGKVTDEIYEFALWNFGISHIVFFLRNFFCSGNMPQYKLTYFDIYGLGEGARLLFHQAGVKFDDNRIKREDWPALKPRNMPQYKLTYFDIYGLGEGARLLFHQAGVKFDDNRIKREDWPALKPKTPFGQLPLLEVDGEVLAQSTAIYRYLGRQFGLAGKTPMEEAQVDSIFDVYRDLDEELRPFLYALNGEKEGDKDKLKKEVFIPAREKYFPAFEKFLAKSGSEYLVGKSLTWADIVISDAFAIWETLVPDFLSGYPELKKFVERVRELPNIKKWISERPKSLY
ncbi:Glutathione S-transferase 1 [Toxocara canis]|uniref:glutathione transferase n=1 Tax=Toxocara canis TaxID=6265 RepID=A0A0B2UYU2_TOXCA|nr:Glutathione S-transferase 1 [Toxocara canis]